MNKKKKIILIVIIVLIIISLGLWISWIIPEQIAKNSAEKYLKENFPEKQFEYENIEWVSSFGGFDIKFKDENGKTVSLIMGGRFFPDTPTEGTNDLEEGYKIEYKGISDINDFYNHSITENYTDKRGRHAASAICGYHYLHTRRHGAICRIQIHSAKQGVYSTRRRRDNLPDAPNDRKPPCIYYKDHI